MTKEDLKHYVETKALLTRLCKEWAKDNLEDWQHYSGFEITNDLNIVITYTYSNFWNNTEYYTECDSIRITLEDLLKYGNKIL